MTLETIYDYLLIFDQEIGFDILKALEVAKDEYMEGWDTIFTLDGYSFTFFSYFGEDWAEMRSENKLICSITPYGWEVYNI